MNQLNANHLQLTPSHPALRPISSRPTNAPFHCLCMRSPVCVCVCECVCRPCKSHKETDADCDCSQFPFDVAKCVNFGRITGTHTHTQAGHGSRQQRAWTHVLLAGPSSLLVVPACPATILHSTLVFNPLALPASRKFFNAYANFAVKFCVQHVDSLTGNFDCHAPKPPSQASPYALSRWQPSKG